MAEWTTHLKADATDWLLEKSNPSVRYLTLINILDRDSADKDVRRAREEIMKSGVVPRILDKQSDGSWNSPGRFYVDKYRGTAWQLIILAEHEADGRHAKIKDACEYILGCSQDPESYGFAYNQRGGTRGGRHSEVIPCLTGNMIWSLVKLGYGKDRRVARGIDWIARYQRFDDGIDAGLTGWPYEKYEMCWGKHSCHMGVVKSLKALSVLPMARKRSVGDAIKKGCEYLLDHRIYRQSHDPAKVSRPGWLKLQFPLMYQTDILEVAMILLDLGVKDERMQDAIDRIASKQSDQGQWSLEATFNGRFQVDIEKKGKPSKWITYRALRALKQYYGGGKGA